MELLRRLLDDSRMPQSLWGAPSQPWGAGGHHDWGLFFSSFHLANRASMPANSKTNPITNRFPTINLGQKWSGVDV
jgi:hypothetical protein